MLLTVFTLSFAGKINQDSSMTVELVGLYWHFVDIVWIVIFTVVYLIPTGNPAAARSDRWPRRVSTTRDPRRTRRHQRHRGRGVHPDRDHPRHHGGRGCHLLHRGRQGLPRPAPVLLLVRQVHARRVVVHAPQVRQPDVRPLLLDGALAGAVTLFLIVLLTFQVFSS